MKNDKNFKIKLVLLWVFAFSVMIFIMSMSANAEEPYFPMDQNDNNIFNSTIVEYLNSNLDWDNNYIFAKIWSKSSGYYGMYAVTIPKDSAHLYGEILSNGYQFQLYTDTSNSSLINVRQYEVRKSDYRIVLQASNGALSVFGTLDSSLYNSNNSYVSNFRMYTGNNENATVVLKYGAEVEPLPTGVAIEPLPFIVPEYFTGDTPPTTVPPSYTINNYTWTTAPQFDGSTVINGIQSIKDTIEWLSSNLHEELANLINNIKGLAEYIGKTIQYYGNAIIETINNAIQNFYDNMKALVEPIYTKLEELYNGFLEFADLFIHPFNEEEFEDQIENCQLISQYNELMDNADDIRAIFNNAEERDYFVLYIDFENPFADSEHKIIHSEISFTWLKDYRSTYRPFLWLFTMIECFVGGMRLLGGIIGGKAK